MIVLLRASSNLPSRLKSESTREEVDKSRAVKHRSIKENPCYWRPILSKWV
jgi:hypothetical protein